MEKLLGDKTYRISDELREVAERVRSQEQLELGLANIQYLLVYPYISKTVAGRCIRSDKELKFFSDYDYLIEASGRVWDALDDDLKYILAYHELLHVDSLDENEEGVLKFKIRDHDVQDFAKLINRFGVNWIAGLKSHVLAANELDPEDEDKIKL